MTHRIAEHTIEAMLYLSMHEFSTPEREQKLGTLVCVCFDRDLNDYYLTSI
jgi:hypothetical protein